MRSKSAVVGTLRSLAHFLESIKYQASALDLILGPGRVHNMAGPDAEGTGSAHER